MEEWDHQGRLAARERRAAGGAVPGVLRGGDTDQHDTDARTPADRRRRLCRGAERAWSRDHARRGRGRALPSGLGGAMAVTPESKSDLAARAARVIPGGVNSGQRRVPGLEELVIAATSGATFTDGDGRTYTDYHAAFGPPLLGHNDPDVDGAVAAAAKTIGLMGVGVTR